MACVKLTQRIFQVKVEELVTEVAELRAAAAIRKEELYAAGEREAAALTELAEARALLHQGDSQDLEPHGKDFLMVILPKG